MRVITSPFHHVEFRDFFLADIFNSMMFFFISVELFSCSYFYNHEDLGMVSGDVEYLKSIRLDVHCDLNRSWITPVASMLPPYWRFMQCLRRYWDTQLGYPHLLNSGKYLASIVVVWILATYEITGEPSLQTLWICSAAIASIYNYWWDVVMDWGLFKKESKNVLLRTELAYGSKWVYYFALVLNFFLRFLWIVPLAIGYHPSSTRKLFILYLVALGELIRRFQWNFFRLENEHLSNCGQFRVIKQVPLPFDSHEKDHSISSASQEDGATVIKKRLSAKEAHILLEAMNADKRKKYANREYDARDVIIESRRMDIDSVSIRQTATLDKESESEPE